MTMTDSASLAQERTKSQRKHHRPSLRRRLIWVVVAAVLLLVGYKTVRVGVYGWQAYRSGTALLSAAGQDPSLEELPRVQASLGKLAVATAGLDRELRVFAPLLHKMGFLPRVGGTLAAAPELLSAGSELTALGSRALDALGPALRAQEDPASLDGLLAAVVMAAPDLAALSGEAETATSSLVSIPAEQLPPELGDKLSKVQMLAPALASGLEMTPGIPALLGFDRPATYLLLVQNNQELRATGGFITAVGTLTLDRGRPTDLSIKDSYQIYNQESQYSWAPEPMQRYMNIDLLLLRDANWSPDFPRTAQLAKAIYAQDAGQSVDGVVSADLRAVQLLFEALGPLTVPGAEEPITAANIMEQLKRFFEKPTESGAVLSSEVSGEWWAQRKDFMPALAGAALGRLSSGQVNYSALVEKSLRALNEGAIQIWVDDSDVASQLAKVGWDGGVHPEEGADFLLYVDTNMGYNKVDAVMERALTHQVSWPEGPDKPALVKTSMAYRHPIEAPDHECDPTPRYGDSYDEMTQRCYFDYVRLYAPGGSELIDVEGVQPDSVSSQRGESGTQVFSGYFVMKPGDEHTVTFTYRLPADITPDGYRLVVQKQSGVTPTPLTVRAGAHTLDTVLTEHRLTWAGQN